MAWERGVQEELHRLLGELLDSPENDINGIEKRLFEIIAKMNDQPPISLLKNDAEAWREEINIVERLKTQFTPCLKTLEGQYRDIAYNQLRAGLSEAMSACGKRDNDYLRVVCAECLQELYKKMWVRGSVDGVKGYQAAILCAQAEVIGIQMKQDDKKEEEILKKYEEALKLDPACAPALNGKMRINESSANAAYQFLDKRQYNPALAEGYYYASRALFRAAPKVQAQFVGEDTTHRIKENYQYARDVFNKIQEADYAHIPVSNARILLDRAKIYFYADDQQAGVGYYEQALKEPSFTGQMVVEFFNNFSLSWDQGEAALPFYEKALEVQVLAPDEKKRITLKYLEMLYPLAQQMTHHTSRDELLKLTGYFEKAVNAYKKAGLKNNVTKKQLYEGMRSKAVLLQGLQGFQSQALQLYRLAERFYPRDEKRNELDYVGDPDRQPVEEMRQRLEGVMPHVVKVILIDTQFLIHPVAFQALFQQRLNALKAKGMKVLLLKTIREDIHANKEIPEAWKNISVLEVERNSYLNDYSIKDTEVRRVAKIEGHSILDLHTAMTSLWPRTLLNDQGRPLKNVTTLFSPYEISTLDWLDSLEHPYRTQARKWVSEITFAGALSAIGVYAGVMAGMALSPILIAPALGALALGAFLRWLNPEKTISNTTLLRSNLSMTVFAAVSLTIAALAFGLNPFSWMALAAVGAGVAVGLIVYLAFRAGDTYLKLREIRMAEVKEALKELGGGDEKGLELEPQTFPMPGPKNVTDVRTTPTAPVPGAAKTGSSDASANTKSDTPSSEGPG